MILTPEQVKKEKELEYKEEIDRLTKIINDYLITKKLPIEIDVTEYSRYAIDQIKLECIKSSWKVKIKHKQDFLHGRESDTTVLLIIEDRVIPIANEYR